MSMMEISVVGAVIVDSGRVLCAKRGSGVLAGKWEFPGGKVEPGESLRAALIREIAEELLCHIAVGAEIVSTTHPYDFGTVTLTTFECEAVTGTPMATEHSELRWCNSSEMASLAWAPADIPAAQIVMRRLVG